MTAGSRRLQLVSLAASVVLAAAGCITTDQGGYGYLGINQTDHDVVITLDSNRSSAVRLSPRTKSGIAFGWSYGDGTTLTVMRSSCSVLGSKPVVGPSTVLTIGADGKLTTDPDRRVFDAAGERLISAESDRTCEPFVVSNRTKQDVVFRFGDRPRHALFVPSCEDMAFDPAHVRPVATPPPTAVEVDYVFEPGQPALMPTVTITAERMSLGYVASSPPCHGLAPTSAKPSS